jgi:hypothetical protein
MKNTLRALTLLFLTLSGCSSTETDTTHVDTTSSAGPGGNVTDVRGDRYCEILLGHIEGTKIRVDVYNTYPLNDCPAEPWNAIDAAQIEADTGADVVILNGPRHWLMDAFSGSSVVDPTVVAFGGIDMRLAGVLELAIADVQGGETAYSPRTVARTTTWVYDAGKPVHELVDPEGRVFDMQSYTVQEVDQTLDTLAVLGEELALPAGWTYRTRVLDAELEVTAVDGVATVVQDDVGNTYQLSQQ